MILQVIDCTIKMTRLPVALRSTSQMPAFSAQKRQKISRAFLHHVDVGCGDVNMSTGHFINIIAVQFIFSSF
jgi:hypothetical protein